MDGHLQRIARIFGEQRIIEKRKLWICQKFERLTMYTKNTKRLAGRKFKTQKRPPPEAVTECVLFAADAGSHFDDAFICDELTQGVLVDFNTVVHRLHKVDDLEFAVVAR